MNINDLLLLEKRISQISSKIEVTFGYDLIKTTHAEDRSDFNKRGLKGDYNPISNSEMAIFVNYFKNIISEGIATGDIINDTEFVIRSIEKELSMAILAEEVSQTYWKLIIKTVFRESEDHKLRTRKDQLIYEL